jgi:hypothetical protein
LVLPGTLAAFFLCSQAARRRQMDKEQQELISLTVREFIDIKYELALYVDEGLIELGERFDKAISNLVKAAQLENRT